MDQIAGLAGAWYSKAMEEADLEGRLEKIETKLAFLEDFLLRLQEETVKGNVVLNRLGTDHRALKSRFLQLSRDLEDHPNRKPPHY